MDLTRKKPFYEWWSLFKFNNLKPAPGRALKFYTNVEKGVKMKVKKFEELIHTFAEVTVEKLVEGLFALLIS